MSNSTVPDVTNPPPADAVAAEPESAAVPDVSYSQGDSLYIQIGSVSQQAPVTRFVIEAQPETAEFYREQWLLGDGGNARYDAGIDIPFPKDIVIAPGELAKIDMLVRVRCLNLFWNWGASPGVPPSPPCGQPSGFWLLPRSSIAHTAKRANWADDGDVSRPQRVLSMPNAPGLIDPTYPGTLKVQLHNPGSEPVRFKRGEAVVQIASPMLAPAEYCRCMPGSALSGAVFVETARTADGFGSTGAAGSSTEAAAP